MTPDERQRHQLNIVAALLRKQPEHAPDYRPLAGSDGLTCAVCYESWPCKSSQSVTTDRHITTHVDHARPQHNWPYNPLPGNEG